MVPSLGLKVLCGAWDAASLVARVASSKLALMVVRLSLARHLGPAVKRSSPGSASGEMAL